jgi:ABC-type dipeptide/oligopeptide/nickel transport system permease component
VGRFIIRRLLYAFATLLMTTVVTFGVAKATPGGPFGFDDPAVQAHLPLEQRQRYIEMYGLDKPIPVQYWNWLSSALQGDLGYSYYFKNETILHIFQRTFPVTAKLGLISSAIGLILGTLIGVTAALKRGTLFDTLATSWTVLFYTMPTFILAVFLMILFVVELRWLPVTGWGTWKHAVLPIVTLTLGPLSSTIRFARAKVLDVTGQDFVRTAKAKGLPKTLITRRHIIKNSLIPIVTLAGPTVAGMLTGSLFVESMFNVPGMSKSFVGAAGSRDYPLLMASTVIYGAMIIMANLLVDVAYGVLDPRIRYD